MRKAAARSFAPPHEFYPAAELFGDGVNKFNDLTPYPQLNSAVRSYL